MLDASREGTPCRSTSGQLDEIAPGVRRLVARNPGFMTGPGTNTYLVGTQRFAVIDPGPARPRAHRADPGSGRRTRERDPGDAYASGSFAGRRGACAIHRRGGSRARRACARPAGCDVRSDASARRRRQSCASVISRCARSTRRGMRPITCAILLEGSGMLFSGDHVMQGSTVVIGPPDGNMKQYLQSLARLQREPVTRIAPGHGTVIEDAQAEDRAPHRASPAARSEGRRNACVAPVARRRCARHERLRRRRSALAPGRERLAARASAQARSGWPRGARPTRPTRRGG